MKIAILLCILLCASELHGKKCGQNYGGVCNKNAKSEAECRGKCCWDEKNGACSFDMSGINKRDVKRFIKPPGGKPKNLEDLGEMKEVAKNLGSKAYESIDQTTAKGISGRSLNLLTPGFGGSPLDPLLASVAGLASPECPVDIKICHRVPCGGYNEYQSYQSPQACYANPLCCYDYTLAFYRQFFGANFMPEAPLCYYGPTSKQWQELTRLFRPWNPWFTSFILELFNDLFDTSVINIQGKSACALSFFRRTCVVHGNAAKRKRDCNLRGCCWKDGKCSYPDDFAQQYFRDSQTYPELYTNDPNQAQCKNNPFDYGPSAYGRIQCAEEPVPSSIGEIIRWCPNQYCCVNPLSLPEDVRYLYLILQQNGGLNSGGFGNGFSGGIGNLGIGALLGGGAGLSGFPGFPGIPGIGGPSSLNPASLALLGGSLNLTTLFCPYYFASSFSGLGDLSSAVSGCCDIPACYHKKTFFGGGGGGTRPPTRPPTQPPVFGQWGPWSQCNAPCRQYGTRTRTCLYGGTQNPAPQNYCSGRKQEQCLGQQCQPQSIWGEWAQGSCSEPCGPGTVTRSRTCYYNNRPSDSTYCNGPAQDQQYCNNGPCQQNGEFRRWEQISACSVTCGSGTATFRGTCYYNGQPAQNPSYCRGSGIEERTCNAGNCPVYNPQYGSWEEVGPCGAQCGEQGLQLYTRTCYVGSQAVGVSNCAQFGPAQKYEICYAPSCPARRVYYWGIDENEQWGPCQFEQNGNKCMQSIPRACYYQDGSGQYRKANPQTICPPCGMVLRKECDIRECLNSIG